MLIALKASNRALSWLLLPLIVFSFVFWRSKDGLPERSDILPELSQSPAQRPTTEERFKFEYGSEIYEIAPRAEYEIRGLVVSHNNIHAFDDIYHDSESVDIKDLCLIWGNNALSGIYQHLKFWSEPWSCHAQWDSRIVGKSIDMEGLSNNHILATSESVRETIRNIRVGEQVRLSGVLVDYYPRSNPVALRKTSLVRDDTGNGACEVFLVREAEILRPFKRAELSRYMLVRNLTLATLLLKVVLFVLVPYLELKAPL